jgi:L-malate glycosyltransferase
MKVLFIASWYPNSVDPVKGIYIKKHAQAIRSAGVEIEVLALTVNRSKKFYEKKVSVTTDEAGIKTHVIELNSMFYKFIHLDLFSQYMTLRRYYFKNIHSNGKPTIIHSNVLYPAAILAARLSKKLKVPHVITEHWSLIPKFMKRSLYSFDGKKTYKNATKITVVSEFLKKRISPFIIETDKVEIIPNVINTSQFSFRQKAAGNTLSFICTANWREPKRPDLIFAALERIREINKNFQLVVVGEGILLEEQKKKTWGFPVIYKGNLNSNYLAMELQNADYFLHASDMETFSIVVAEALSTGTPVLASNAGAIPDLVNSENGFLAENTVEDWTSKLKLLIEKKDWNYKAISESTLKFNEKSIGEKFKELYQKII